MNVSRLQNAADAAVLAGALKLVEEDKTMGSKGYYVLGLTATPDAITNENNYHQFNIDTGEENVVDLKQNKLNQDELEESRQEAHSYATKNLYEVGTKHDNINGTSKTINEWTTDKEVKFSATLYTRIMDANRERYSKMVSSGSRYYKVELTETIDHLFFRGFDPMKATVVAWAVIKPHDTSLLSAANENENKTIHNVLEQGKEEGYSGKWAHFQDEAVYYTEGDSNRTEVVNIHNDLHNKNKQNSDRVETSYTKVGGTGNGENLDSLNLDFRVEYGFTGSYNGSTNKTKDWNFDWDLRSDLPEGITKTAASLAKNWTTDSAAADLRVLTSFNFNYAWTDRNFDDLRADVLWTHIENDPWWFQYGSSWNSVHQIVINAKEDNTAHTTGTDSEGKEVEYYTQRPFYISYTGPETYDANSTIRQSQPVILNLYYDWNAILYMPNSPVIINGNGHKLTGFVIAKEYLLCKTDDDYLNNGYIQVTDGYGKTLFVKADTVDKNFLTEDYVTNFATENGYIKSTDDKGNISLKEEVEAPIYPILTISKDEVQNGQYASFTDYINATYKTKFMAAKGLSESEIDTVTFPTGQNLCDDERYVVAKTDIVDAVPANAKVEYVKVLRHFVENNEEKTEEKYIPKTSLPYVKVRRNETRAYVSVYDLQKTRTSDVYGLNTVDESLGITGNVSDDDLWQPSTDTYKSDKFINKKLWDNTYTKEYIDSKLTFVESGGLNCFMRKSEIPKDSQKVVAEYRKVTNLENGTEVVKYIKEETTAEYNARLKKGEDAPYYVKVAPDGATGKDADGKDVTNYIIVDNKGDLQTKRITPAYVLTVETVAENTAAQDNSDPVSVKYFDDDKGYTRKTNENEQPEQPLFPPEDEMSGTDKYRSKNRPNEDYKIPVVERVYKAKEAFKLNEASCYSYFRIADLVRQNYTYLNVDELNHLAEKNDELIYNEELSNVKDMFFTTKRAGWMD